MANTKSAEKRIRTSAKRQAENTMYRSRMKTIIKKAEQLIFANKPSEEAVREAQIALDKGVSKGVIHKNAAARKKSRMAAKVVAKA